jgi:histidinol-phosphate aminotransferase
MNADLDHLVPSHVRRFEAYVPSSPDDVLMRRFRLDRLHRLHNNENPLGPPPAARAVLAEWPPARGAVYPQGDGWHLRRRLATHFGLDPDQVILGNGATEAIAFVVKAFCEQGDNIVTADRTFAVYEWIAEFSGIATRLTPLTDFAFDEAALLAALDARSKVIFLCNPNNPTAGWWPHDRLARFLEAVDGRTIVVVDEAYAEYVTRPEFPDTMALMRQHPNLVVFRTFSKIWGLAALRIGYLLANAPIAATIRKTAISYSVNALALEAALAAVWDHEHVASTIRATEAARAVVAEGSGRLELPMVGQVGPYVMLQVPGADTHLHRRLLSRGMMVRAMTSFRFPGWLRVSLGDPLLMQEFMTVLEEELEAIRRQFAHRPDLLQGI